ncbi:MAG: recombination protein RecR [Candidatus Abawacabacteria bacterium]|nr:recombination protein RecR [Candidatus Abawacabacteria bacterium]
MDLQLPLKITTAIQALAKLPGIGPKSASRLVYHLIKKPYNEIESLGQAIIALTKDLHFCELCFQIADSKRCGICGNEKRNHKQVMVVEEPLDVLAFERTKDFQGVYHVLHGILKPMEGIGPEQLKIAELVQRIKILAHNSQPIEVILAINPSLEGESTSAYIAQLLHPIEHISISRIGVGIPIGSSVEYADEITLTQALQGRRIIQ